MKIRTLKRENVFIPEFNGNKDLPENEQIIVNIKGFPGLQDINKIKKFKFDDGSNVMLNYDDTYALKNFVGAIKNLELDNEEVITNGSSLASSKALELEPLVAEIRNYLLETQEVMTEGEN